MITAGVRELRQQLSKYLRRVAGGEQIVVTQHGEPVALLIPPDNAAREQGLYTMVKEGAASWQGDKPHGADNPIVASHGSMAHTIAEDRR